jgi:hypothetical protein
VVGPATVRVAPVTEIVSLAKLIVGLPEVPAKLRVKLLKLKPLLVIVKPVTVAPCMAGNSGEVAVALARVMVTPLTAPPETVTVTVGVAVMCSAWPRSNVKLWAVTVTPVTVTDVPLTVTLSVIERPDKVAVKLLPGNNVADVALTVKVPELLLPLYEPPPLNPLISRAFPSVSGLDVTDKETEPPLYVRDAVSPPTVAVAVALLIEICS